MDRYPYSQLWGICRREKIMWQSEKKSSLLKRKLAFTAIIALVYIMGRCIPLYGVYFSAYAGRRADVQALLVQTISGDVNRCSLFALGISPYMMGSILVQMFFACRRIWSKTKVSPKRMNRAILILTLLLAVLQAFFQSQSLLLEVPEPMLFSARMICGLEMVTGAMLIVWLVGRNKRYGFGKQTILIYINILDGMASTLGGHGIRELAFPLVFAAELVFIMLIMEGAEFRIPVQRISIHNIYADKNYLAVKLNPVGVMPIMFSTAFFMLPQLMVQGLFYLFPGSERIAWWHENLMLTRPLGIVIYIAVIYLLTISFALLFISPGDITEQLMKGGDSILNLHAGRDTKRYLVGRVCRISLFGATVMSVCMGLPMFLQFYRGWDQGLMMFPASAMILTGIWYSLYQEYLAVRSYDCYRPFI